MKVLIVYFSKTGHTEEAAQAIAQGIKEAGSDSTMVKSDEFSADLLPDYDALLIGSPCRLGGVSKKLGVAPVVKRMLLALPQGALSEKKCGGFSVHCAVGAEHAVINIGKIVATKGCENYIAGPVAAAGAPLSLWTGKAVAPEDRERFSAFGKEFVSV